MVWYNPLTWFQSEETPSTTAPMLGPATAPADMSGSPYGGRKGKKTRRARKGSKRSRTGKRSTRS